MSVEEPIARERRAYNRWTEADVVTLAKHYGEGMPFKEIVETLGRPERAVRSMVGKLKLNRHHK